MRILHTEWSRGWGGQEIRILAESEAFLAKGYDIRLGVKPGSPIMAAAAERGIPTAAFPFTASVDPRTVALLAAYVRRERIEIVHTHSSVDAWTAGMAGRLTRRPVVRSRHLTTPISTSPASRFLYMGLADRVICSGQAIKDTMIEVNRFDPEKIVSVPAGADENRFRPGLDAGPVRREFGLTGDDHVVGMVAIFRNWKGHKVLLDAAKMLREDIPELKLLLVGDGPDTTEIEAYATDIGLTGAAIFTGYRNDVPELMSAMDQFILPSIKNEATSQVIPQAQLVGIPVIASTAGGLTEVVEEGVTGRLVPPGDSPAIREAVLANYRQPDQARSMAGQARRTALEKFTFAVQVQRTEKVYLDLAGGRGLMRPGGGRRNDRQ